jgi:hypothetical protein
MARAPAASLPVYSEAMLYGSTERCLLEGGYKLMYDQQGDQWRLYDARKDPLETVDLSAQLPQRVESMRRRLTDLYARLKGDYEALRRGKPVNADEEERRRAAEALDSLGYVGD